MGDKEVGELWRYWTSVYCPDLAVRPKLLGLIRKLVEERRTFYIVHESENTVGESLETALRDFGIDPATWK